MNYLKMRRKDTHPSLLSNCGGQNILLKFLVFCTLGKENRRHKANRYQR
ncbi:hypothetical protein FHS90_004316 [Rufibacter quisquiliarum]|uniref:Uncharacterized protein n=1 Tax=Rufibacter quisquiliarum TaxID=1549639 RepID=A0A839GYQ6_9BACT|nr:hypothetical protein [Rufibacter quisquiliarum]